MSRQPIKGEEAVAAPNALAPEMLEQIIAGVKAELIPQIREQVRNEIKAEVIAEMRPQMDDAVRTIQNAAEVVRGSRTMPVEDDEPADAVDQKDLIDRSRPIVEHNPPWMEANFPEAAHYQQLDGFGVPRQFNAQGVRIRIPNELPDGVKLNAPVQRKGPKIPTIRQQQRQEDAREAALTKAKLSDSAVIVGDVNLTAWMLQKADYPWAAVRKAINERFSKVAMSIADAQDFLLGEGVVTAEMMRAAGVSLSADR